MTPPKSLAAQIAQVVETDIDVSLEDWWEKKGKDAWGDIYGKALDREPEQLTFEGDE